jgi:ABC-type glutathione transport system ATPase component
VHESLGTRSAQARSMPLLEVERLSKSYRQVGGATTVAIAEISFQVEAGELVAFVGPMWLYSSGPTETRHSRSIRGVFDEPTNAEQVSGRIEGARGATGGRIGATDGPDCA